MKKAIYTLISLFICSLCISQTNTFPTSGNVGIGTTSPNYKAEILSGTFGLSGGSETFFEFNSIYSAVDSKKWRMAIGEGQSAFFLTTRYDNGAKKGDILKITNSGDFGIGTFSPNDRLHVSKAGANTRLRVGNNSAYDQLLYFNGAADWSMGMDNSNSNAFTIASTSSLDNSQRFTILSNGNTGIGTTSPTHKLSVDGFIKAQGSDGRLMLENASASTSIYLRNSGSSNERNFEILYGPTAKFVMNSSGHVGIGTTSPSRELEVHGTGNVYSKVFSDNGSNSAIELEEIGGTNWSLLNEASSNEFKIRQNGQTKLTIADNGNIGVGTTNPSQKLSVDGTVLAKQVKVSITTSDWPDYVFAPSYELRSLSDLEKFIADNQHLPEVPSAKEVEKEGLDLGKMDATLLQKVEELTLYLIDVNKKQEQLIKEVESLKKENAALKKKVNEQ